MDKARYAEVYLNIRTSEINSVFDYKIPENIKNNVKKGTVVTVPFGKKLLKGIVTKIKDHSCFGLKDPDRIKEIIKIPAHHDIDSLRLRLAHWISYYYAGSLGNAFRLFLPPDFNFKEIKKKYSPKKEKIYKLSAFSHDLEKYLKTRPSQKKIIDYLKIAVSAESKKLLEATGTNSYSLKQLLKKGYINEELVILRRDFSYNDYELSENYENVEIALNPSQKKSIDKISEYIKNPRYYNFLLEGVTGSGKTEVYIRCVKKVLEKNKTSIILTPEISLIPQLYSMFKKTFKEQCCVYHSAMSESEKYEKWYDIRGGRYKIIIGTRSALFTPFKDPGIVIIDEFHDASYKENSGIRYCTIKTALRLCRLFKIPVLLGSATPSIWVKHWFENDLKAKTLKLEEKIFKESRVVKEVVDLKKIDKFSEDEIVTNKLFTEIQDRITKKEKIIIFINRRGYSKYIICGNCGFIPKCENCNLPYTYHSVNNKLKCHHCGREVNFYNICLACGSKRIKLPGTGIQKVEEKIKKRFPDIKIVRMDSDSTSKRKSHEKILTEFIKSNPSILIGTQMVSKGLDIKNVTLVGIINIDSMFSLPDYSINEKVFQLLTQVSGRTGRGSKDGQVIVQTYETEGIILKSFIKDDFNLFYKDELKMRKKLGYPPYSNLINIIISGNNYEKVKKQSYILLKSIKNIKDKVPCEILGPSPAPFSKINKNYRWHILVKSFEINKFLSGFTKMFKRFKIDESVKIITDVDPYWIL